MSRRDAEADEIDVAQRVIDRFAAEVRAPTYARIDLLRSAAGAPLILELELIEPSLFLDHHPEAADRLVELLRAADGLSRRGRAPAGDPRPLNRASAGRAAITIARAFAWHEPWGAWALPDPRTRERTLARLVEADIRGQS